MCSIIRAPPTAPAFLVPSTTHGLVVSLTHDSLVKHLKTILTAAGLSAAQYSGHSSRRGGATFAWRCGAEPQLIKILGDWSSDAFEVYLDSSFSQRKTFKTGGDTSYLARVTRYYGHVPLTSRSKSRRVHSVNKVDGVNRIFGDGGRHKLSGKYTYDPLLRSRASDVTFQE
ncbi:hypothetical protein Bbelb_095620 [Branchiostoma belcheri]|nr:hypothetical protein Bbelb_095620 [Branchiostoma belcheri]